MIIQPDSVGPTAGAKARTIPTIPMANPRLFMGKISINTVCSRGTVTPPAKPCINLAVNSTSKFVAKAPIMVPMVKRDIEVKNSVLVLNRLIRKAVKGITIPRASMYPVLSH